MFLRNIALFLSVFSSFQAHSQVFERVYGLTGHTASIVKQSPDKGFVVLGTATDSLTAKRGFYILKTDSTGNIVWEKTIANNFDAFGSALTIRTDGSIAIIGTHTGVVYDAVTEIKILDSAGNVTATKTYPPFEGWGSSGIGITASGDTGLFMTMYTNGFISTNYYSIFRLKKDLSVSWNDFIAFDGSVLDPHDISMRDTSVLYTLGYYDDYFYSGPGILKASEVRKTFSNGTVLHDSIYEFGVITQSVSGNADGGAILSGIQDSTQQRDIVLIRLDAAENVIFQRQYGSTLDEESVHAVETFDGGYALLATVEDSVIPGQHNLLLMKTDSQGDSLWSKTFGGVLNEKALHLEQCADSGFILLATTTSFGDPTIYLVKTDSDGNISSDYSIDPVASYYCSGDTATLRIVPAVSAGSGIAWSTGDSTPVINATQSGAYHAVITDSTGKEYRTEFQSLYFAPQPVADLGSADTAMICSLGSVRNLTADDASFSYQWFFDGSPLSNFTSQNIIPLSPGLYTLVVSNYCGSDTASVFIDSIVPLPPQPIITAPPVDLVCPGDSLPLSVSGMYDSYQWWVANGNSSVSIQGANDSVYYATTDGVYYLEVTNASGCASSSNSLFVIYDNFAEVVSASGPVTFCSGGEVLLSVSNGHSHLWSTGDTTATIHADSTGLYYVSFINQNGCFKQTDSLMITVHQRPVVNIGTDTVLCNNDFVLFDAGSGFLNYLWQDQSTASTFLSVGPGTGTDTVLVWVFVTDTNACTNSDSLNVIYDICTGFGEGHTISSVSAYPNPVKTGGTIMITGHLRSYDFVIFDVTGRKILAGKPAREGILIPSGIESRIYFLDLENEAGRWRIPLFVQ